MVARPSESRDDHGKGVVEDSRQTRLLAFGLVIAVLVFFQSQVRLALDAAHSFESRVGLALVPSAIILAVVFLIYRVTRRHDASLRAAVTDSVTQERRTRTTELDSLTAFGLSLSRANDIGVIRDLAQDRLLRFSGGRPCWAVMRAKGTWESIVGGVEGAPERVRPEVEQLAEDVLTRLEGAADAPEGSSGADASTSRWWPGRRRLGGVGGPECRPRQGRPGRPRPRVVPDHGVGRRPGSDRGAERATRARG